MQTEMTTSKYAIFGSTCQVIFLTQILWVEFISMEKKDVELTKKEIEGSIS